MTDEADAFGSSSPTVFADDSVEPLFVKGGMSRLSPRGEVVEEGPEEAFSARYEMGETIARGGMGEVVACVDRTLRREVALKRMRERTKSRGHLRRFVREAQITAQLSHPSIVPVYELGLGDAEPYFTMKRVEGETLEDLIGRIRAGLTELPLNRRLRMMIQVCHAVSFAHSRGVLHRDLKPSNIMVGAFGEVLVMDWGLARLIGTPDELMDSAESDKDDSSSGSSSGSASSISAETLEPELRTRAGQALGTPQYMSPEQARGELSALDEGTDIYSLGAVLLSFLTLRRPVEDSGARVVIERVKRGEVERIGLDESVPAELVAIVEKAMAFERERRYESVKALIADLDAYLSHGAVSAYQDDLPRMLAKWARRNRSSAVGLLAGGVALAVGLVLASGWAERQRRAELERRLAISGAALVQAESEVQGAGAPGSQGWYEAQSAALARARELRRLEANPAAGATAVARHARRLAHQLAADSNLAMSSLMLREAEDAGLPREAVAAERAFVERLQRQEAAAALVAAKDLLLPLEHRVDAPRETIDEAIETLCADPHPELRELLLASFTGERKALGGRPIRGESGPILEICVRALDRLGTEGVTSTMSETYAPALEDFEGRWPEAAPWLRALRERHFGAQGSRVVTVEQTCFMTLVANLAMRARWASRLAPLDPSVEAILPLIIRDADPLAAPLLTELAWLSGIESSAWLALGPAVAQLPRPDHAPRDALERRNQVRWALLAGEPARAAELLEALPEAVHERARTQLALGDFASAAAQAELLIAAPETCLLGLELRARARLGLGQLDGALADARASAARAWEPWRLELLGQVHEARGEASQALAVWSRALNLDASRTRLWRQCAELHEARGELGQALACWTTLVEAHPEEVTHWIRRGSLWLRLGAERAADADFDAALARDSSCLEAELAKLEAFCDNATAIERQFSVLLAEHTRHLESLRSRASGDPRPWLIGARLLLMRSQTFHEPREQECIQRARDEAREAVRRGAGDAARRLEAEALAGLGDWRGVEASLRALETPQPSDRWRLALSEVRGGKVESGLEALRRACREDPGDAGPALALAEALVAALPVPAAEAEMSRQLKAARGAAEQAWLKRRMWLRFRMGHKTEALEDGRAALALAPEDPETNANYAFIVAETDPSAALDGALRALGATQDATIRARAELALQIIGLPVTTAR